MYLRMLSVELALTVFTLQRCTDNIGIRLIRKALLKGLSLLTYFVISIIEFPLVVPLFFLSDTILSHELLYF